MRVGRLIFAAVAACCVSGLAAQAQVQKQIQISPDILTKRPALTPELKLQVFDLPDLAITHLSGPTAGPDEAGHVELTIDLKNFGESQFSLNFLDVNGQVQPTLEVLYQAPGQSLGDILNGTRVNNQSPVVKRVFLDAILNPGQKLSSTEARYADGANLISISLPDLRDEDTPVTGVHRLVVILDPAETVIERSRRNNIADFTWVEQFEAVSPRASTEMLRLTRPTKKPLKQKAPELLPFE